MSDILTRDFWWKLLAFVLATLVWANFGGKLNDHVELDDEPVPSLGPKGSSTATLMSKPLKRSVSVLRAASDSYSYQVDPIDVTVVIKGEAAKMRTLDPKQILVFVDVTDTEGQNSGLNSWRRMSRMVRVNLPAGVEQVSIEPQSVIVEKIFPVEPEVSDFNSN